MRPEDRGGPHGLLGTDKGVEGRDLRRQIGALERNLDALRRKHGPLEPLHGGDEGGAAVTAENLEDVRDELLGDIYALQERVALRFASGIEAPPPSAPPEPSGWRARLRRNGEP